MSQFFQQPPPNAPYGAASAQNLQFYPSSYAPNPVSGHATPSQAAYGYGASSSSPGYGAGGGGFNSGFGAPSGVSGRMGEQGGLRTGWLAAFGTEGYDGEPPLLEELGVKPAHIWAKTLAVLNPLASIDQHIMDDSDLGGPLLFFLLFGTFLLLSGKVHFGYIYGLALLGSTSLHLILSLMSPPLEPSSSASPHHEPSHLSSTLTFPRSASVLGYCLLPLVLSSLVGVAVPMDGLLGYVLTSLAIVWCTYSSSGMFCAVGRMRGMRGLVAYPLALFYAGFGIMGIFSSRGSKGLAPGGKVGVVM
ncbi:putative Golgi membrane protein [Venustampulla echinocandica]|uniref:Protein YIP n=1 Tax=Venustampulla echinocandica TaxID=2656787 RepID=A0A370U2B0_9HELO|nr:putative Golgi membrane protein [Venustampulla echinocandica]RDL41873.1 putative Golgi membrane protein [Venustampulla echinocandica]